MPTSVACPRCGAMRGASPAHGGRARVFTHLAANNFPPQPAGTVASRWSRSTSGAWVRSGFGTDRLPERQRHRQHGPAAVPRSGGRAGSRRDRGPRRRPDGAPGCATIADICPSRARVSRCRRRASASLPRSSSREYFEISQNLSLTAVMAPPRSVVAVVADWWAGHPRPRGCCGSCGRSARAVQPRPHHRRLVRRRGGQEAASQDGVEPGLDRAAHRRERHGEGSGREGDSRRWTQLRVPFGWTNRNKPLPFQRTIRAGHRPLGIDVALTVACCPPPFSASNSRRTLSSERRDWHPVPTEQPLQMP